MPEKLNLWDRIFNRYRYEILSNTEIEVFGEDWDVRPFRRDQRIIYLRIDRLTGSEKIIVKRLKGN